MGSPTAPGKRMWGIEGRRPPGDGAVTWEVAGQGCRKGQLKRQSQVHPMHYLAIASGRLSRELCKALCPGPGTCSLLPSLSWTAGTEGRVPGAFLCSG